MSVPFRAPERLDPRRPPRHLRIVRPDERVRRRALTPRAGVLATAGLFAALLALAVTQTLLVQGQLRLDDLHQQLAVEQAEYQRLRLQVADLESPERIVTTAKEQLGMVSPDDLVYLSPSEPVTRPDDAAGPETAEADAAGDDAWAMVKPLLEAARG